ncbi:MULTISPECIES: hypothetical protein [unclassified Bradyrhizobium]
MALRTRNGRAYKPAELARAVQDELFPYELNYFREAERLSASLERLDALWINVSQAGAAAQEDVLRARESAAMLATARWMYRSAESRGMHRRDDFPARDERERHYITAGGLDEVWSSVRPRADLAYAEAAE